MSKGHESPQASILKEIQQTEQQIEQQLNLAREKHKKHLEQVRLKCSHDLQSARESARQRAAAFYKAHIQKANRKAAEILTEAEQEVQQIHQTNDSLMRSALDIAIPILVGVQEKETQDDTGDDPDPHPWIQS